jgi:hypothetical protein
LISRVGIDEWTSPKKNILQGGGGRGGGGGGGGNGFRDNGKWFQKIIIRRIITESKERELDIDLGCNLHSHEGVRSPLLF